MSFAEKVKKYYELGLWSKGRLRNAVMKGALTREEYVGITGEEYAE